MLTRSVFMRPPTGLCRGLESIYADLCNLHRADPTPHGPGRTQGWQNGQARQVSAHFFQPGYSPFLEPGRSNTLGLSKISASTLRRVHAVYPIAAVQVEHSLVTSVIEDEAIRPTLEDREGAGRQGHRIHSPRKEAHHRRL